MDNKKKKILLILFIFSSFFLAGRSNAQDNFNPNYIISDSEITNYSSMSFNDIDNFLKGKNSYLKQYSCQNPDGKIMTAAEIIYDRATTNKVNPRFLLALLQKEQGLIEDSNPTQSQLNWATGYGCPDGGGCNSRWQGFWKQVNSASLQFRDYLDNPHLYTYKAGQTYTFTNTGREPTTITLANQATAALYNYTPHVYNGNYNFYKIWQRYFTTSYPDGSLVQVSGEIGVWLIQNGQKRPFVSRSALISRFDQNKIIEINKADLDKYEKGAPIKFPQYSLVRTPSGAIYLLVDNKRRGFVNNLAFKKIGFNPEEIMEASWEDIDSYEEGEIITATSTYAFGALLQNKKTGGVYWVIEGVKAPILDKIFLKTKFKREKVIAVAPKELENFTTVSPVLFNDGEIIKSPDSPAVYVISNRKKRVIASGEVFEGLGYKWTNVLSVPEKIINLYETGEPLAQATN
jgi:hypothetical protein